MANGSYDNDSPSPAPNSAGTAGCLTALMVGIPATVVSMLVFDHAPWMMLVSLGLGIVAGIVAALIDGGKDYSGPKYNTRPQDNNHDRWR